MRSRILLACLCVLLWSSAAVAEQSAPRPAPPIDDVTRLVMSIEKAVETGDAGALRALATPEVRAALLSDFVQSMTFPAATRSSVKERDRAKSGDQIRLLLEVLTERGIEGRVTSWRVDAEPGATADEPWKFAHVERLTNVSGLFRLSLDATEYDVRNLVVTAPDLTLTLPAGSAFLSRTPDGATAVVLLGRGRVEFSPQQKAEQGQLRIFSGRDTLATDFDSVFIRVNPDMFEKTFAAASLIPRDVDARHLRRATELFETYVRKSFLIDLNDLSTSRWSLVPTGVDFVAEIVTGKFGPLTYARATSEPEDISFFDRRRFRNIAVYSTDARLDSRGRFFSEDDRVDYDITSYDIQASFEPDRLWVDGTARLTLRPRGSYLSTVTLRLADPLVVRSVSSPSFGRLLHMRVVGQNNVLVGFPSTIVAGTDIEIVITYGGRLAPQGVEREAVTVELDRVQQDDVVVIPLEPQYTYSNRSYWYPQSPVTDYATAKLTLTVPGNLDVVASGARQGPPTMVPGLPGTRDRKQFEFEASRPTRYLAVLISRFQSSTPVPLTLGDGGGPVAVTVAANPRQVSKVRNLTEKTTEILGFYTSLLEHAPYEAFTLALTESDVPGGHSPGYFALLNSPLPTSPYVWSNDPVSFSGYPSFFIAHEIAHQWWGQAVGWKNYHEQWISEGFSQYFAALFAERERGTDQFVSVLRQMRRTAIDTSSQGPVYLGYRLGHIKNEGRVFRALVYNKGAMVLHMLRRLIGDDAFFAGLRDFYSTWRFRKAGTDDFRAAMEKAGGRPLGRFFDRWIFGSDIPEVRFTSRVTDGTLHVTFDQKGEIFDIPIAVTVNYTDGSSQTVFVNVTEQTTEQAIPLKGAVRQVEANKDHGALVTIER